MVLFALVFRSVLGSSRSSPESSSTDALSAPSSFTDIPAVASCKFYFRAAIFNSLILSIAVFYCQHWREHKRIFHSHLHH